MKKFFSRLLVFGLICIFLGGIIFLVALGSSGWSIKNLSGITVTETVYTEDDSRALNKIKIDFDNTDLKIIFDENADSVSLTYPQRTNRRGNAIYSLSVSEAESTFTVKERENWLKNLFIWDFNDVEATLVIPASRIMSLDIDADNGDINLEGIGTVRSAEISTDNGDIRTTRAEITSQGRLLFDTDNGDLKIGKFDTSSLFLDTNNGDILLTGGTASEKIELSTDNGETDIRGKINTPSIKMETDNGDIETDGGLIDSQHIDIESDNGEVEIKLSGSRNDYSIVLKKGNGDSNVTSQAGGSKNLKVDIDNGDLNVYFEN